MKKFVAAIGVLLLASVARAEPIQVTSGSMNNGSLTLSSSNFSFDGIVRLSDGVFWPTLWTPEESRPGGVVSISGYFVGLAISGIANYLDRSFNNVGGLESDDSMAIRFMGDVTLPEITEDYGTGHLVSLTTPFGFEGRLSYIKDKTTWEPGYLDMTGYGKATVTLRAYFGPDYPPMWEFANVKYDITPAHAPEPATLVLFASGLAATVQRVRRRRKSCI